MLTISRYIREHPEDFAEAYARLRPIKQLEIEVRLDWRCNARCKFCGVWKYSREGLLPPDKWRLIFTDLAAVGVRHVQFTGGEPLLNPHFVDLLHHVDRLGVETSIITNGSLLNQRRVEQL